VEKIDKIFDNSEKLAPALQFAKENAMAMPEAPIINGLRIYSMAELMSCEFPDTAWVVDELVPEGITILSAMPGSYKTWLLLAIAISVASGTPLFGSFATEQTGVLIIDEENGKKELQRRLRTLGGRKKLPIHFQIEQNFKLEDEQITNVIRFCENERIRLIMLDSLVRVHIGSENDATEMAEVFSNIKRFTKVGINVLITHHQRKGKSENYAESMRGSSDILAAVDCHLALAPEENHRIRLIQTKIRSAGKHDPIEIEIVATEDKLTLQYVGTVKPSESKKAKTISEILVILKQNEDINQKELLIKLEEAGFKVNAKTLRNILNDLVGSGVLNKSQGKGSELLYRLND